tara:strand:+ start:395 stop:1111 length:717 start_codon:yes stop_codon:yes gene_type:complete
MKNDFFKYNFQYFLDLGATVKIDKEKKRKTISLQIKEKLILVKVPKYYSNDNINKLLYEKKKWIRKKIEEIDSYYKKKERKFLIGDKFFLYGEELILVKTNSNQNEVIVADSFLNLFFSGKDNNTKKIIENWYKKESLEYLVLRTSFLAKIMSVKYNSVKIKNFKRRLGSCSYKNDIVYNWRIIMSPKEIIDYIIIHELCHTVHFNHSKNFWILVKEFSPYYKDHKSWLKKNIEMLHW